MSDILGVIELEQIPSWISNHTNNLRTISMVSANGSLCQTGWFRGHSLILDLPSLRNQNWHSCYFYCVAWRAGANQTFTYLNTDFSDLLFSTLCWRPMFYKPNFTRIDPNPENKIEKSYKQINVN